MKPTEARILLYLDGSDPMYWFATHISFKLDMDYGHVIKTLGKLSFEKYVHASYKGTKKYYILTPKGKLKLDMAKALLSK